MNIRKNSLIMASVMVLALLTSIPSNAFVEVTITGGSNGVQTVATDGPKKFKNKKAKKSSAFASAKGGELSVAKGRAVVSRTNVKIGTQIKGKSDESDNQLTESTAVSQFLGTATFKAAKKGQSVDNFELTLGLNGLLSCLAEVETEGQSIASSEYFLTTYNRRNSNIVEDSGLASQDGLASAGLVTSGGFDGTGSNLSENKTSFSAERKLDLGTLQDGDVLDFIFTGVSFVSWGSNLTVSDCNSDFFNTNTFKVAKKDKKKKGRLKINDGGKVLSAILFDPDQVASSGDERLLINDVDAGNITNTDLSIRILGPFGSTIDDAVLGAVGDINNDGIPDVELTSVGKIPFQLSNQTALITGQIVINETTQLFSAVLNATSL